MSIRSVRNSSANWRSCALGQLAQIGGQIDCDRAEGVLLGWAMVHVRMHAPSSTNVGCADRPRRAAAQDHLFQPAFCRFQLGFAMAFQRLAALVKAMESSRSTSPCSSRATMVSSSSSAASKLMSPTDLAARLFSGTQELTIAPPSVPSVQCPRRRTVCHNLAVLLRACAMESRKLYIQTMPARQEF